MIIAAVAVPNLVQSGIAARKNSAISAVRTLITTQYSYESTVSYGSFATDLVTLGNADLIDDEFATGTKSGYTFTVSGETSTFTSRPDPSPLLSQATAAFSRTSRA